MRPIDPARSRVVLIGTPAYHATDELTDVPQVGNNVADLVRLLTDPRLAGFPTENCVVVPPNADLGVVGERLIPAAAAASDTLLVYYAGHGVLGRRGELYLGLFGTRTDRLPFTALPFDAIRDVCLDSPAANRVVILDCCYSGRATGEALSDVDGQVLGQITVSGSYTLTASPANRVAKVLDGEPYTAFTGRLLTLLERGLPGGGELLTLGDVYRHLRTTLQGEGLSVPEQRGTGTADLLGLVRNVAYRPGSVAPGGTPVVTGAARLYEREREAIAVGEHGAPSEAVRLLRNLLIDRERINGAEDAATLRTKYLLGVWTGRGGERTRAVELLREVLADQQRILPAGNRDLLLTRAYLAQNIGQAGNQPEARQRLTAVHDDQVRVLGARHEDTLQTRFLLACNCDPEAARHQLVDLLPDLERELGPMHALTLDAYGQLAFATGSAGDAAESRRRYETLIPMVTQRYGAEHPYTIRARHQHARQVKADDRVDAEHLLAAVVDDAGRALGADHTVTLDARLDHAMAADSADEQLRRLDSLGRDQLRLLGADHPGLMYTRRMQVAVLSDGPHHQEAYRLCRDVLADHARVLGPYHRHTMFMREMHAAKAYDAGAHPEAIRLRRELLTDQRRVLGPEHPDTVKSQQWLARHDKKG
ncbi:caspase family protein [Solwaraspora sp. WMMD406]|uniref:caspase, EACC1-associated type n=1 Tax=Solwaraspora sp. WMMD406 TaxID=3016095 RepID=UPI002417826E|nr:tetratricopeptide repeat protein [Solwaraspora sp. WMMD406]MDG4764043.1 caspase family protein [Solwaraspora sp. WMMD406]